jgi:hypothetical protein
LGQPLQVLGFDESLAYGKDVLQIQDDIFMMSNWGIEKDMKRRSDKGRNGKKDGASLFSARPSGYAGLVLLLLLFLLTGCVRAKPTLTYQPLQEKTFQSRTQPASLSQKSAETLIQEGFVKVGYLSLNILKEICKHYTLGGEDIQDKCITAPDSDPLPWLMQRGQAVGGDLVVIEFEKPYTEIMNMIAKDGYYRKEFSAITAAVWRKDK